ncbi:MAG: hypothetical protein DMG64_12855, partial [Acidobacteria bacterium]
KETVYDGPDIELFKPKQPASSASRETVHVGEVPEHITRRYTSAELAQLPKPQTVTVHEGAIPEMFAKLGRIAHDLIMPDRETIYQGPELRIKQVEDVTYLGKSVQGVKAEEPVKETVFNETTFIAKKVDTSASRSLVTRMVQRASARFFAVAALSLFEMYFSRDNLPIAISSGVVFVAFSILGFYTFKLNLKALLFAIGLYACRTIFIAVNAIMGDGMFMMLLPLFLQGFMVYNLLRTYGLLVDLHLLEAEIY